MEHRLFSNIGINPLVVAEDHRLSLLEDFLVPKRGGLGARNAAIAID
jgi:hypothetical protein